MGAKNSKVKCGKGSNKNINVIASNMCSQQDVWMSSDFVKIVFPLN